MIGLLMLFLSIISFGNPSWKWSHAIQVVERHEYYTDNEIIIRPKNTWQTLFGILYRDANLNMFKDCLFYQVPGDELGILKIKSIPPGRKCQDFIFAAGDKEWKELKALQFSINNNFLSIGLTHAKFEVERWEIPLFNLYKRPAPRPLLSSAEYRSSHVIFLTPYKGSMIVRPQKLSALKDKTVCHEIAEDCQEKSPSVCTSCENGWYEIPNGCSQGPKYCGKLTCGLKNGPACRRGMKYQKAERDFGCRQDQSFAYCSKGLSIHCQGDLPYCL